MLIPLLIYHLSNSFLWNIGTFPWFMIAITSLFFNPEWPDRLIAWFKRLFKPEKKRKSKKSLEFTSGHMIPIYRRPKRTTLITTFVICWIAVQLLFPLRHFAYSGSTFWHGQGQYFAWRMLLVDRADAVKVHIDVPEKGRIGQVKLDEYINYRQFLRLCRSPKSFVPFAKFIKKEMKKNTGVANAEIYVTLFRGVNARPYQLAIDSTIDLSSIRYDLFGKLPCLMPYDESLPKKHDAYILYDAEKEEMGLSY